MKNLIGKWIGYYEYGLGYELPFFGERVIYQIEISFEDEDFLGTSKEEKSKSSVDSIGKINGYIEDDLVSFVKTYPIKSTINEDNVIEIFKKEQLVNHTGYLDKEYMTMYGLWTIEQHTIEKDEFYEPDQLEGIWLLKKQ